MKPQTNNNDSSGCFLSFSIFLSLNFFIFLSFSACKDLFRLSLLSTVSFFSAGCCCFAALCIFCILFHLFFIVFVRLLSQFVLIILSFLNLFKLFHKCEHLTPVFIIFPSTRDHFVSICVYVASFLIIRIRCLFVLRSALSCLGFLKTNRSRKRMRVKSCRGSPEYWMNSPCGKKIISNINSKNHDDYRAPERVERGGAFTCRMVFANSDTDGWKCRASCREHQTLGYTQKLVNTSSGCKLCVY